MSSNCHQKVILSGGPLLRNKSSPNAERHPVEKTPIYRAIDGACETTFEKQTMKETRLLMTSENGAGMTF